MAAVSETIVREFFELHGFFVHQQRKFVSSNLPDDEAVDFLVLNPHATPAADPLPFELKSADLARVSRALVVVRGGHTETFSPAVLTHAQWIFRQFETSVFKQAARAFGDDMPPTRIMIVPALPQAAEGRAQSIELLRARGIDAIIPFRTLLADLINGIEVNRNYQKSDLLQTIRVLKNYEFLREPQMDLFKPAKAAKASRTKTRAVKGEDVAATDSEASPPSKTETAASTEG